MTVTTEAYQSGWLGWTGIETAFAPGFAAAAAGDVTVEFRDALDVVTVLALGVHYTITLEAGSGLITVTPRALPAAPGALRLTRNTPALQPVNFANLSAYDATVHTRLHDAAAMRDAELKGALALIEAGGAAGAGVASLNGKTGALRLPGVCGLRLSLVTGTPVMTSDVLGANRIYATPDRFAGNYLTLWNGIDAVPTFFGEVSQLTTDATRSPGACEPNVTYDVYGFLDIAGIPCIGRSDYWKKSATVTMTIASPGVVTWTAHSLGDGYPIVFTSSGALPTGVTAGTRYYVKSPTGDTFNLALTPGGAAINTSGTQSGTHTGTSGDDPGTVARAAGGNCEIDFSTGLPLNKNPIVNGPAALRGTFLGSVRTNAAATIDWKLGSAIAGGGDARLMVSNAWNRRRVVAIVKDTTVSSSYTSTTPRLANNSAGNRVVFVSCMAEDYIKAEYASRVSTAPVTNALGYIGLALDALTFDVKGIQATFSALTRASRVHVSYAWKPQLGVHGVQALEAGDGTNATSFVYNNTEQALTVELMA